MRRRGLRIRLLELSIEVQVHAMSRARVSKATCWLGNAYHDVMDEEECLLHEHHRISVTRCQTLDPNLLNP